eukprot:290176-Hanusia_phi.AAC.2
MIVPGPLLLFPNYLPRIVPAPWQVRKLRANRSAVGTVGRRPIRGRAARDCPGPNYLPLIC